MKLLKKRTSPELAAVAGAIRQHMARCRQEIDKSIKMAEGLARISPESERRAIHMLRVALDKMRSNSDSSQVSTTNGE
jgi:hypothetical protein